MTITLRPGVAVSGTLCLACGKEHEPPFCDTAVTREQARAIAHEYFARVRAHKREQEDAARREDQRQTW